MDPVNQCVAISSTCLTVVIRGTLYLLTNALVEEVRVSWQTLPLIQSSQVDSNTLFQKFILQGKTR